MCVSMRAWAMRGKASTVTKRPRRLVSELSWQAASYAMCPRNEEKMHMCVGMQRAGANISGRKNGGGSGRKSLAWVTYPLRLPTGNLEPRSSLALQTWPCANTTQSLAHTQ